MSHRAEIRTPEAATWVREIVAPMIQEQMDALRQELREDSLKRLERSLTAMQERTEERFDRLENAIAGLAEAQKHTEQRVEELAQAQQRTEQRVEKLAQAQRRTEEAQQRTEQRVEELAQAQQRTEERVEELAQAQQRTEQRVEKLAQAQQRTEERVEELAQAQQRTEQRVEELAQAQQRTEEHLAQVVTTQQDILKRLDSVEHQVGALSNAVGVDAEADAEDTLIYILERKGYRLLETPYALAVDGEVDVVVETETPEGEKISVLMEAKARARLRELHRWSGRLQDPAFQQKLIDAGVSKPFLPYLFGLRVYQIVDDEARKLGIGVMDPNQGERVAPAVLD